VGIDDRIREELERLAAPPHPAPLEEVERRRRRLTRLHRTQRALLQVAVVVGTVVGAWALYGAFTAGVREVQPGEPIGSYENGDRILFSLYMEEYEKQWSLYSIRSDGSGLQAVTPDDSEELYPDYSPDSSQVAFVRWQDRQTGIWVMDADGSNQRLLWAPDDSEIFNVLQVEWSPDGERIGFVLQEQVWTEPPPEAGARDWRPHVTIWTMNVDGSDPRQIIDAGEGAAFDWSPSGSEIVFHRTSRLSEDGETQFGSDIFIANADGTGEVMLTGDGHSWNPAWSPDGSRIAYETNVDGSDWELQVEVMNVDGTHRRVLAPGADRFSPSWSPDGSKILAVGRVDDPDSFSKCHLYLIDVEQDSARSIFQSRTSSDCPNGVSWQPVPVQPEPVATEATQPPVETTPPAEESPSEESLGCSVSSVRGDFDGDGSRETAYGFYALLEGETCKDAGLDPKRFTVAVDMGDRLLVHDVELCEQGCRVSAAPDVDGDGSDELLVVHLNFSILRLGLYDMSEDGMSINAVTVAPPGDPQAELVSGEIAEFWIGGDGFNWDALRCDDRPEGRVLVATLAHQEPPDSADSVWKAHETTLQLLSGELQVLSAHDFDEPVDIGPDSAPSFATGEELCGTPIEL